MYRRAFLKAAGIGAASLWLPEANGQFEAVVDGSAHATGWVKPSIETVAQVARQTNNLRRSLRNLIVNDDKDGFAWRALYVVKEKSGQLTQKEKSRKRLSSKDQMGVGKCVGSSGARVYSISVANTVLFRKSLRQGWQFEFSEDGTYGLSRHRRNISGDGSSGAWCASALKNLGSLHETKYDSLDLSRGNSQTARSLGRSMPAFLLDAASTFKGSSLLAQSTDEVKAAAQNGYCTQICSLATFSSKRDSNGVSPLIKLGPGAWAHAMAVVGYALINGTDHFLVLNSWGDNWNSGGVYPDDMPEGSFWCTKRDMEKVISQGDSWIVTDIDYFKRTQLTWEEVWDT